MKSLGTDQFTADILVVDDTHANLQLLTGMLKERGYKVRPALNGELAIQAAKRTAPDLILLDINMPGLSGYEVAEILKKDENLREIPILFLSALSETMDKVKAFNAGGVDYVVKPFQFEEVAARVETHLKIRRLKLELESRNKQLEQRNAELRELQELRDGLFHMIVHDLRAPLAVVLGYLDMFNSIDENSDREDGAKYLQEVRQSSMRMLGMVNSLLDVNKMEAGQLELCPASFDLAALARESFNALEPMRAARTFEVHSPNGSLPVYADRDLIGRVLQNLVGNALKYAPPNSIVRIGLEAGESVVRVSVIDSGCGIAPDFHSRLFTKFGQIKSRGGRVGTGLGLVFCKLAIEAHKGRIGLESEVGKGSNFWFEIPTLNQIGL